MSYNPKNLSKPAYGKHSFQHNLDFIMLETFLHMLAYSSLGVVTDMMRFSIIELTSPWANVCRYANIFSL